MGWMTMDSSSDEDEPSAPPASSPAPVPAPEAAAAVPPPRKRAKVQEPAEQPAEPTHEEDKNTAAAAAADDDEEVQALYGRYVERFARQGLSPSEAHARLTKTFGSVLTLEEVASLFKAAESSQSSSSLSSSKASTTSTAPATSNNGAAEEKHMGRPADAEQQRVILETVEHNPRVSLRTVAAAVGCSKSQVARVLALNGFQRNKGRVGEWQRAPLSPQAVAAAAAQARAVAAAAARAWRAGKREERLLQHQRQHELARQLERE